MKIVSFCIVADSWKNKKGYYIYYEKNPEMLHYMERENNRHVHIVEQEDDRVVRNIRGIMEEKEKFRTKKKQKEVHMGYGIAGSDCIDCRVCICCADAEPVCAQSGEAAVEYNPDNEPVAPGKSGQDDCRDTESKAYPVSINGSTNTGKIRRCRVLRQRPYLRHLRKNGVAQ